MIFFENLKKYDKEIVHGVMEEKDGSANPFSSPNAVRNILAALSGIGFDRLSYRNLVFAEQIHGSNICFCHKESGYIKLATDSLISKTKEQVLIIKTADCLPILFYDPENSIIGAIHAGRKGLARDIVKKTIRVAKVNPARLIVGVGPHIRKCCYFLRGKSIKKYSRGRWRAYVERRENKLYLDLTKIAINQLVDSGVKLENIEDSKICTFCQGRGRFYSARRSEIEGNETKERLPCFGSFISLI